MVAILLYSASLAVVICTFSQWVFRYRLQPFVCFRLRGACPWHCSFFFSLSLPARVTMGGGDRVAFVASWGLWDTVLVSGGRPIAGTRSAWTQSERPPAYPSVVVEFFPLLEIARTLSGALFRPFGSSVYFTVSVVCSAGYMTAGNDAAICPSALGGGIGQAGFVAGCRSWFSFGSPDRPIVFSSRNCHPSACCILCAESFFIALTASLLSCSFSILLGFLINLIR